jgi:hypothetical protein
MFVGNCRGRDGEWQSCECCVSFDLEVVFLFISVTLHVSVIGLLPFLKKKMNRLMRSVCCLYVCSPFSVFEVIDRVSLNLV